MGLRTMLNSSFRRLKRLSLFQSHHKSSIYNNEERYGLLLVASEHSRNYYRTMANNDESVLLLTQVATARHAAGRRNMALPIHHQSVAVTAAAAAAATSGANVRHVLHAVHFSTLQRGAGGGEKPSSHDANNNNHRNKADKFYHPSSPPPRTFMPRKAPIELTERARTFLKNLLESTPSSVHGIMLRYQPSTQQGQMRMVFSFDFVKGDQKISMEDEEVSLELLQDGSPKPPTESYGDGLKKLYVHSSAFMKVLGSTMDIELKENGDFMPIFKDREGNELDPNA